MKKFKVVYELTLEIEVDEKVTEFELGTYAGIVNSEIVKKAEDITKRAGHEEENIDAKFKRIL